MWKVLGSSICCILYAARRPADPVKSCPCFILRRFLPRASYLDICFFCAPEGRIAPIGASRLRRSLTARLRRDGLIPKKTYRWPCFTLPLHLPGALLFARPKGALRLSARLIPNRSSYPESVTSSRVQNNIPNAKHMASCLLVTVHTFVYAFYHEICFCAPEGRIALIGA